MSPSSGWNIFDRSNRFMIAAGFSETGEPSDMDRFAVTGLVSAAFGTRSRHMSAEGPSLTPEPLYAEAMRRDFDPSLLSSSNFYRLLTAVVVPRPIAWVSSTSAEGVDNLAPHSFFTVASLNPPIIQFTSVGEKDTLRNVRARGEFVVNLAPAGLMPEVNATGTNFPSDVSEFDAAGLTREAGRTVGVPRVVESPAALECRLHAALPIGDCVVVFGEVTYAVVDSSILDGDHPRIDLLAPLSRLGLEEWGTLGAVEEVKRIRRDDWPGDFRPTKRSETGRDS